MNKHHPLDGVFRDKLRDFEAEAPMHLWEQVSQKRNRKHRFINQMKQRKPLVGLAAAVVVSGLAWTLIANQSIQLDSFPIPAKANVLIASAKDNSVQKATAPTQTEHKDKSTNLTASVAKQTSYASYKAIQDGGMEYADDTYVTSQLDHSNQEEVIVDALASLPVDNQTAIASLNTNNNNTIAQIASSINEVSSTAFMADEEELADMEIEIFDNAPACADWSNQDWAIFADVLVSPDVTFRNIEAIRPEYEGYAKSRKESEQRQYAFSTAIRLSLVADNGFALRTGLNYSQINEKFSYFNGTEVKTSIEDVHDNEGNIIGTDTVVEIGSRYKVTHNTYHMLDIPFIVGFERRFDKWNLSLNGGTYLNLLLRQNGDMLSPDDMEPVSIDSNDPDAYPVFKRQVGLGWYGSVGIGYQLNASTQLLVEPHLKVYPKSITQEQFGVDQRYSTAGLFIGIRKKL
ncbi:MAG: PorT family protein [Chitinophagales bacterium]|nr:PorT family protein [Chitinophagales bacterium]